MDITKDFKPRKQCYADMIGKRFGTLTIIGIDEEKTLQQHEKYYLCQCDCGKIKSIRPYPLVRGEQNTCGDRSVHRKGDKNSNWKGGKTPEILSERTSQRYNNWRDSVYAKDWYTCQCCGKSKNINRNAHNLKNFSSNIEERYNINNGITLCEDCHYSTIKGSFHNVYGTINNTPEQLEEYINNKRKELGINIPFNIEDYLNDNILKPNDIGKNAV